MACVDRWLNYGVSLEALLRALVLRQSQGIRGGAQPTTSTTFLPR